MLGRSTILLAASVALAGCMGPHGAGGPHGSSVAQGPQAMSGTGPAAAAASDMPCDPDDPTTCPGYGTAPQHTPDTGPHYGVPPATVANAPPAQPHRPSGGGLSVSGYARVGVSF